MSRADQIFVENMKEIMEHGVSDEKYNVRPHWADGTPAHTIKKFGIINASGKAILPLEYEDATPHGDKYIYHDGLALVEKDGKLGFVDIDGKLVIPYYFDQAFHFTQGLACVRFNGMWGYIDTKGDVYMPFVFDYASPFEWGRAEVVYNGTVSNVDLRGKCVKNCNGVIAWRNWKE